MILWAVVLALLTFLIAHEHGRACERCERFNRPLIDAGNYFRERTLFYLLAFFVWAFSLPYWVTP